MEPNQNKHKGQFRLPDNVINQHDVSKLIIELDGVDDFFIQVQTRRSGDSVTPPQSSAVMEDLLQQNQLNLLQKADREKLKYILQTVRNKAPIIHMSFSADPERVFLEKVISWLRSNVNSMILLQVGLQPNIGAGFTLRTNNKFFDFSLRQRFVKKRDLLIKELTEGIKL